MRVTFGKRPKSHQKYWTLRWLTRSEFFDNESFQLVDLFSPDIAVATG